MGKQVTLEDLKEDIRIVAQSLVKWHTGREHMTQVPTRDLWNLVGWALKHEEISMSKAREILGVSMEVIRATCPDADSGVGPMIPD